MGNPRHTLTWEAGEVRPCITHWGNPKIQFSGNSNPITFYDFGDFGLKMIKMVKISKNMIFGKVYPRLAPVCELRGRPTNPTDLYKRFIPNNFGKNTNFLS